MQDFDIKDTYYKGSKIVKKIDKKTQSKLINKFRESNVKTALKKLNKTLFE